MRQVARCEEEENCLVLEVNGASNGGSNGVRGNQRNHQVSLTQSGHFLSEQQRQRQRQRQWISWCQPGDSCDVSQVIFFPLRYFDGLKPVGFRSNHSKYDSICSVNGETITDSFSFTPPARRNILMVRLDNCSQTQPVLIHFKPLSMS